MIFEAFTKYQNTEYIFSQKSMTMTFSCVVDYDLLWCR